MRWLPLLFIIVVIGISSLIIISKYHDSKNFLLIVLSLIYVAGLSVILFTPIASNGISIHITTPGLGNVNKTRLYLHGLQFYENIILTIPIGMIFKKLVPQLPIIVVGLLGVVLSTGFEVTQYYLSHYFLINRSTDINDIIANTTGIIIGGVVMWLYTRYQNRK